MVRMWLQLQRGHSGDGCVLASSLCKYDLRKGDLFVLSWARVRQVRRGSLSSELLVCGGGVPQPTRVQDLLAVNVTSQSQADKVNRNAYRYSVVILILFICK